jgi:hypothetical protein
MGSRWDREDKESINEQKNKLNVQSVKFAPGYSSGPVIDRGILTMHASQYDTVRARYKQAYQS